MNPERETDEVPQSGDTQNSDTPMNSQREYKVTRSGVSLLRDRLATNRGLKPKGEAPDSNEREYYTLEPGTIPFLSPRTREEIEAEQRREAHIEMLKETGNPKIGRRMRPIHISKVIEPSDDEAFDP